MRQPLVIASLTALALVLGCPPARATNDVTIDGAFADWSDEYCKADPGACDDFPNQQDTKGACIASNFAATTPSPATTVYLRFDFDVQGLSGANTADACWLIDTDTDGNSNAAICMELAGNLFSSIINPYFTCNDSAPACGGPVAASPASLTCAFTNSLAAVQQLECSAGDAGDAAVECSISTADLGVSANNIVTLISGCTFGSAQPNSATHDCATEGGPFVIDLEDGGNTPVELIGASAN
jgi:hypothetical protein